MTEVFEIPLSPSPQRMSISLDGTTYQLVFTWCSPSASWTLDILAADNTPLILGIPLVTGADLLAQYEYIGIRGKLIVQTDHDTQATPTFDNLGLAGRLYYEAPV